MSGHKKESVDKLVKKIYSNPSFMITEREKVERMILKKKLAKYGTTDNKNSSTDDGLSKPFTKGEMFCNIQIVVKIINFGLIHMVHDEEQVLFASYDELYSGLKRDCYDLNERARQLLCTLTDENANTDPIIKKVKDFVGRSDVLKEELADILFKPMISLVETILTEDAKRTNKADTLIEQQRKNYLTMLNFVVEFLPLTTVLEMSPDLCKTMKDFTNLQTDEYNWLKGMTEKVKSEPFGNKFLELANQLAMLMDADMKDATSPADRLFPTQKGNDSSGAEPSGSKDVPDDESKLPSTSTGTRQSN